MTAVANAALQHARTEMKLRTVTALVNLENAPSIRLLEKLGFVRTETLPAFRACGGVPRDYGRYEHRFTATAPDAADGPA